jgi:phospholipid/cholesterol/gamma-HCH transport system substrate-binding protein
VNATRRKRGFAQRWERLLSTPGLKRDVMALSVLIIVAIGSMAGTGYFLGGQLPWTDHYVLRAEFEQVPGLNPDATPHVATIAGVRVGDITDYEATDRGTAIVTMELNKDVPTIYDNATALLRPKNPLNDMQITINPGTDAGKPLASGGLIPVGQTKRPIQINEVLQHLDDRAQAAVTDLMVASDVALANAPKDFPDGIRATDQTLKTLRPVMESLSTRRENIAKLVTALGHIAGALGGDRERATRLADSLQTTLGVLAENDRDLVATFNEFPGLSKQLHDALSATQDLTKELNPTLDNLSEASDELPDALDRFKKTTHELDDTVDSAKDFAHEAKKVVKDLRPFVGKLDESMDDLVGITRTLDRDTDVIFNYLTVLHVFTSTTSSVFGPGDKHGNNIRGHAEFALPDATQFLPGGDPGYSPGPEGGLKPGKPSPFTPMPAYIPGSPERNSRTSGGN